MVLKQQNKYALPILKILSDNFFSYNDLKKNQKKTGQLN
jgi:hypothetical protein